MPYRGQNRQAKEKNVVTWLQGSERAESST